jgi:16S rRNA (guanine527-N7)-methyltransferase
MKSIPERSRDSAARALSGWGVDLGAQAWEMLDGYLGDVLEYGRRTNLTSSLDPSEIVRRHFLDSLAGLPLLRRKLPGGRPRIADLGAGAGFLGMCLKIAWPEAEVCLIESSERKFRFLSWTAARCGLPGLRVVHARAGAGAAVREAPFDAVAARALRALPELRALAFPLGRMLAAWVSAEPRAALGPGEVDEVARYRLPGEDRDRFVAILLPPCATEPPAARG